MNNSLLGWWCASATERKASFCGVEGCANRAKRGTFITSGPDVFMVIPTCKGHGASKVTKPITLDPHHALPTPCPCALDGTITTEQRALRQPDPPTSWKKLLKDLKKTLYI